MFSDPLFIFLPPPLHDFHLLVFDLDSPPAYVFWPHNVALHLVWFPPQSPLPFCLFLLPSTSTPHPSSFLSIPGFIPSSLISLHPSNPHLFLIGAVERVCDGGISHCVCVCHQQWMSGRKCITGRLNLWQRAEGRPLEEKWFKICQSTPRSLLIGEWMLLYICASWKSNCSDDGSHAKVGYKLTFIPKSFYNWVKTLTCLTDMIYP